MVALSIRRRLSGAVLLLAAALLMQACASEVPSPPSGRALQVPGQGIVVGSLGLVFGNSSPDLRTAIISQATVSIFVRPVGGGLGDDLSFTTTQQARGTPGLERVTDTDRRLLFFRALPPGRYVVWRRTGSLINSTYNVPDGDRGLHFTVRAGEVTYIGAHEVAAYSQRDWLGVTSPGTAGLSVVDDVDDDRRHFYHLHPELRGLPFADALQGGAQ